MRARSGRNVQDDLLGATAHGLKVDAHHLEAVRPAREGTGVQADRCPVRCQRQLEAVTAVRGYNVVGLPGNQARQRLILEALQRMQRLGIRHRRVQRDDRLVKIGGRVAAVGGRADIGASDDVGPVDGDRIRPGPAHNRVAAIARAGARDREAVAVPEQILIPVAPVIAFDPVVVGPARINEIERRVDD